MVNQDDQIKFIADKIERYFKECPNAGDSLEGIHDWWLQRGIADSTPGQVKEALDLLVDNKKIFRWELPGGRFAYSLRSDYFKRKH
jgi:hypothetical protein